MAKYQPMMKKYDEGWLLGYTKDKEETWVWKMTTVEMVELYALGAKIYASDKNEDIGRWQDRKFKGWIICDTSREAELIWERYWQPKIMANELCQAN